MCFEPHENIPLNVTLNGKRFMLTLLYYTMERFRFILEKFTQS